MRAVFVVSLSSPSILKDIDKDSEGPMYSAILMGSSYTFLKVSRNLLYILYYNVELKEEKKIKKWRIKT